MLKKENRLKKRKEFNYIYSNGRATGSKYLVLLTSHTPKQPVRIGISISKKTGNAIKRNKLKRQLSSILYHLVPNMQAETTYIFLSRAGTAELEFQELKKIVLYLLNKSEKLNKG